MIKLTILAFLFPLFACAQTYIFPKTTLQDRSAELQKAFNDPAFFTIEISSAITINNSVNIPAGKVLSCKAGCKISGKGTINGGILEANYQLAIFDTSITINPAAVNQYFSAKWFGATGNGSDDYFAIQKSINTCISNNIRTLFIPVGKYRISKPLIVTAMPFLKENVLHKWFCTLEIKGESSFWDSNVGSEIYPTFTNTFALGIQTGKGCKISRLKFVGSFFPPNTNNPKKFFNTAFENFTDGVCRDSRYSPYAAIVIDPFTNLKTDPLPSDGGYPGLQDQYGNGNSFASASGSTATQIEEVSIKGFVVGICSSPNGVTRNAEITTINKVQFENCKLAISGGQDQEKMNVISNIHCWGGTHTIFATGLYGSTRQAGNWNIDHVGIAGGVVRFIFNEQHGYFATYISHVYAESLATWGTINSALACEVSNSNIDFASLDEAGVQTLLTSWGEKVVYRNCNFRYYGQKTPMKMAGNCVFYNCYFSGELVNDSKAAFSIASLTNNASLWPLFMATFCAGGVLVFAILFILKKLAGKKRAAVTKNYQILEGQP